jgi:hypothetical protein
MYMYKVRERERERERVFFFHHLGQSCVKIGQRETIILLLRKKIHLLGGTGPSE